MDTGDAWEVNEDATSLTAEWVSEPNFLRDEYGNSAPDSGAVVLLDADADQIVIESGNPGNENVHFYGLSLAY